jgi:hypothetical protein
MFTESQINPAPACVLLGGPKAIESTQEVCVLLRSPNIPHQAHPSWQQTKRALPMSAIKIFEVRGARDLQDN